MPSMSNCLSREAAPLETETELGGIFSARATSLHTASFAWPSAGAAVTQTFRRPSCHSNRSLLARGVARTEIWQLGFDRPRPALDHIEQRNHAQVALIPVEHGSEIRFEPFTLRAQALKVPAEVVRLPLE